jgi:protein O-mannosyl-transferase
MQSKPQASLEFKRVLFLIGIIFLCFFPSVSNPFVFWDDDAHIFDNALVLSKDTAAIPAIFQTVVNKTYIPLTTLSFHLENRLFGLNPFFFHLDNLLLHILVCLLIYRLFGRMGFDKNVALSAALIYGIHPMHVESVAWVTARKDVLYSLFYVLSMNFYWQHMDKNDGRGTARCAPTSYLLSLLFALLSILAKPMALSLPLILGLMEWYKNKKVSAVRLIPFVLAVVPIAWITFSINRTPMVNPPLEAALIWMWSLAFYLWKFLLPFELIPLYATPQPVSVMNPVYAGAVLTVITFAGLLVYFRKNKLVLFAGLYFVLSIFFLLRVSDVTRNLGPSIVADRFMYLPSLGFCLLLAHELLKRPRLKWLMVALIAFFMIKTPAQCGVWQDDVTLWNHVINSKQEVFLAYNSRAVALAKRGDKEAAMKDFNRALELYPAYPRAFYNRGKLFSEKGDLERALADFDAAIALNKTDHKYFLERGIARSKRQEFNEALTDFNAAQALKGDDAGVYNNRGIVHKKMGNLEAALEDYTKALWLNPHSAQTYLNRANLLEELNRNNEALSDLKRAQSLGFPVDPERLK